jgi:hypothetical protein
MRRKIFAAGLFLFLAISTSTRAADPGWIHRDPPGILGRWDLTMTEGANKYPSWLEVSLSGSKTLIGRYVAQFGSARPVSKVEFDRGTGAFRFVVPPQWERMTNDIIVSGKLDGEILRGETTSNEGKPAKFEGHHAPKLIRDHEPKWGAPVQLFNGKDLAGWKARKANAQHGWKVQDGILVNAKPGLDIMTEQTFNDFKLRAVFRVPKESNSGIYLRGRYEVQIEDSYGQEPESHLMAGLYGFLTPRINAAKPAGEWQTIEITLVGRVVNIVFNGEPVIERQVIPGITGGALDSDEEKPGPLLIQGDHGTVEFKELTLTPAN